MAQARTPFRSGVQGFIVGSALPLMYILTAAAGGAGGDLAPLPGLSGALFGVTSVFFSVAVGVSLVCLSGALGPSSQFVGVGLLTAVTMTYVLAALTVLL